MIYNTLTNHQPETLVIIVYQPPVSLYPFETEGQWTTDDHLPISNQPTV